MPETFGYGDAGNFSQGSMRRAANALECIVRKTKEVEKQKP
jgi:hypothetical protein